MQATYFDQSIYEVKNLAGMELSWKNWEDLNLVKEASQLSTYLP